MSGYHPDTGVFELTATKAGYWFRRKDIPTMCEGKKGMHFYAALLESFGHEVGRVSSNYLLVSATPGQVWEALSGRPSDPEHEKLHLRNPAPRASAPRGRSAEVPPSQA